MIINQRQAIIDDLKSIVQDKQVTIDNIKSSNDQKLSEMTKKIIQLENIINQFINTKYKTKYTNLFKIFKIKRACLILFSYISWNMN